MADLLCHDVGPGLRPEMDQSDGFTVLSGGDSGEDTQTPLTPEEEVEMFVQAGIALGQDPVKARAYAEAQLRKHREGHAH